MAEGRRISTTSLRGVEVQFPGTAQEMYGDHLITQTPFKGYSTAFKAIRGLFKGFYFFILLPTFFSFLFFPANTTKLLDHRSECPPLDLTVKVMLQVIMPMHKNWRAPWNTQVHTLQQNFKHIIVLECAIKVCKRKAVLLLSHMPCLTHHHLHRPL